MFKKYTSIENSYRDKFIEIIKAHDFGNDEYIVQEKAHGANLSYWTTNGEDFYSAKRTTELLADEKFYNFQSVLDELKPKFKNLWNELKKDIPDLSQLTIFGEIIGGCYPHPDVEADKNALKAQKGVFYSPSNHFYAFDILVDVYKCLDVEVANEYFTKHGLLHAKTIFKGSLDECLSYQNDFDSIIPKELNLPDITPNIIEGVVIKPAKTRYLNNGNRVILKNKNEKWAEIAKPRKLVRQQEKPSEQVIELQKSILEYVTDNRLNNVMSKIGEVSPKDIGRVLGLFSKDVVEDFLKDYIDVTDQLEKKELKLITKSFSKTASRLVIEKLKED